MKLVYMLAGSCGSENGFALRHLTAGKLYWLADSLCCCLVQRGHAVIVAGIFDQTMEKYMTLASRRLLKRVSDPVSEPLTLAETKLYLRVDGNEEDALINDLISASRQHAEQYLRRSLMTQGWKLAVNEECPEVLVLPMGPVQSVTSVSIFDTNGIETALVSSRYRLNAAQNALLFDGQVTGHRVEIRYQTGYGGASDIPKPLKQGMLQHIAELYEKRGEQDRALPPACITLFQPYREISV